MPCCLFAGFDGFQCGFFDSAPIRQFFGVDFEYGGEMKRGMRRLVKVMHSAREDWN